MSTKTGLTTSSKKSDKDAKEENPGGEFKNVTVMHVEDPNAHRISLPVINGEPMTEDQAIYWLGKTKEEKERRFDWSYKFDGWYPFDAIWAVYRALVETYGFTHTANFQIKTWFGVVQRPPRMVTIDTGYKMKQQIPWGPMEVSGISVPLVPRIELSKGLPTLVLSAEIRNSERDVVDRVMRKVEAFLGTESIYRGKAVEVDFKIFNPDDFEFDAERAPQFMDTNIEENDVIFSKDVFDLIDVNLWTMIKNTEVCIEHKIPLRRSVLLDGKYGVGKTLAARLTAKLCVENGWTFLYLRKLDQLAQALYFAKKYEPCVIFAEDINQIVSGKRDADMDALFNVMDGVDRKDHRVMTVFTTNDLTRIHAGMLRPGRMDAIITVEPPDGEAVTRLMRLYGRNLIEEGENLTTVGDMLAGQIPAVIRETVERAKLAAIRDAKVGEPLKVRADHLRIAALEGIKHAKRLEPAAAPAPDLEILGNAIGQTIARGVWLAQNHPAHKPDGAKISDATKKMLDDAGRPS